MSGLDICETPIEQSVCAHALQQGATLNIPDLTMDARTRDNPLVTGEPYIRFYAGAPLVTPEGYPLGALCVTDTIPREITPTQTAALEALARTVSAHLEQRRHIADLERDLLDKDARKAMIWSSVSR